MLPVYLKLYYPPSLYNASRRRQVFPLLKPFIKDENFTDTQRKSIYGVSEQDFLIVDSLDASDVAILPMSWNYYAATRQMDLAHAFIKVAKQADRRVWSINNGDFSIKVPSFENLVVFRQNGYQANDQSGHEGFPSVISDYFSKNLIEDVFLNSSYGVLPIVGFCGQTDDSKLNAFREMAKQVLRNLRNQMSSSYLEPHKILPTSYLRSSLLKQLETNSAVDNRFIKRKQYRAGVTKNKETDTTTTEFYNNILESQYVLCVRGAGNFSVRLYETLMMGRIPLYVHTDGYLPLSDMIDWKAHVVWVDYKDRHRISEILLDFHKRLNQEDLIVLFKKNRKLWEDNLTLSGFFKALSLD